MGYVTREEFDKAHAQVTATFRSGLTKDRSWRLQQLKQVSRMVDENIEPLCEALRQDMNKHKIESLLNEIVTVQKDAVQMIDNFDKWTGPEYPSRADAINFFGRTVIRKEPLGVSLIIGAWNYPLALALSPLIAAIAAGCAVIVKPSDVTQHTERLLLELIPKYLDSRAIQCVAAGPQEMKFILDTRFNHIFYTGSSTIGKIIYAAAAKHLTPVTLELGGQAPAIVSNTADIDEAAKRIAAAKFNNAGQICVNVNHVLVDPSVRAEFVERIVHYLDVYRGGSDAERPEYYTHIVNDRNFARLSGMLDETAGKVVYGGDRDVETRYFGPTVVTGVTMDDSLMSDEIFGPLLPIIDADLDTALDLVAAGEHPLALYAFTTDKAEKQRILDQSNSGGVAFNDCLVHLAAFDAPFGGVGTSGFGSYHGSWGVLAFSHRRTVVEGPPKWMDNAMAFRFPPYNQEKVSKYGPPQKITFDQNGNDTRGIKRYLVWGAGAAFAGIAWLLRI